MKLQGRNLKRNMRGDDVKLLQDELRELGFSISGRKGVHDSTTYRAVSDVQKQHDLPTTGIGNKKGTGHFQVRRTPNVHFCGDLGPQGGANF